MKESFGVNDFGTFFKIHCAVTTVTLLIAFLHTDFKGKT